jgi:hypothetical protein
LGSWFEGSVLVGSEGSVRRAISQYPARDLGCELVQREDAVSLARCIYQTGHPPDDGGRLILNNDFAACFTNGLRPEHAVDPMPVITTPRTLA